MTRALAGALLALGLIACRQQSGEPAPPERREVAAKRELALLTSLPLVLGEGFALDSPRHPLTEELERSFTVRLIDGPETLEPGGLLLAVQPQALTAERLVALDRWVREGGRILLLADPRLSWESSRALTDPGRPPVAFPDTGLLAHWGLKLFAPADNGPAVRTIGGREVLTGSPGALEAAPGSTCRLSDDGLVARCAIGSGKATVIADADLVQAEVAGGLDGPTAGNRAAVVSELYALADSKSESR